MAYDIFPAMDANYSYPEVVRKAMALYPENKSAIGGAILISESLREMYTFRWDNSLDRANQIGMRDGDQGYQVDTTDTWRYVINQWVVWERKRTAFTPDLEDGTLGNGTIEAYYSITRGSLITVDVMLTWGTTTTITAPDFRIKLLVNVHIIPGYFAAPIAGVALVRDASAAGYYYGFIDGYGNSARPRMYLPSGSNITDAGLSNTYPITFGQSDVLTISAIATIINFLTI